MIFDFEVKSMNTFKRNANYWMNEKIVAKYSKFCAIVELILLGFTCSYMEESELSLLSKKGSVKYLFITVTSRSTLTRSGNTCLDPISGSNKSVSKLLVLDKNVCNHMTLRKQMDIIK